MMRPDAKVQKVYLYPKPVDFRKSINGLAALVELDIKVEVFNPVLFVFLNRTRSQIKILYWERNGFCLWLKRLEAERFKTKPDAGDDDRRSRRGPRPGGPGAPGGRGRSAASRRRLRSR